MTTSQKFKIGILMLCGSSATYGQCLDLPKTPVHGVSLLIASDKAEYEKGDGIVIHVVFSNASANSYKHTRVFYEREFELRVKDGKGAEAPLADFGRRIRHRPYFSTYANVIDFAPGDKIAVDENLTKVYQLSEPGAYNVSACTDLIDDVGHVVATLRSNDLKITVRSSKSEPPAVP